MGRAALVLVVLVGLLACIAHTEALSLRPPKQHKESSKTLQTVEDLNKEASFWEHRARAPKALSKHDKNKFLHHVSSESDVLPKFILDLARRDLEDTHTKLPLSKHISKHMSASGPKKSTTHEPVAQTAHHMPQTNTAHENTHATSGRGESADSNLNDVIFSEPDLPKENVPSPDQGKHSKTNKRYGVPLRDTHSHLVGRDEVTPGIPLSEYQRRREKLGDLMKDGDVAVFPSSQIKMMSGDTEYEFQQSTNLLYLAGIADPSVTVAIPKQNGKVQLLVVLGVGGGGRFDSDYLDPEVLRSDFGADQILSSHEFQRSSILRSASRILVDSTVNPRIVGEVGKLVEGTDVVVDEQLASELVASLRQYKSAVEIALLTKVFEISARAHIMSMRVTSVGRHESFLRGITGFMLERDYAHHAYPPIIAGGVNGHVLHYHADDDVTRDGNMILMDVGGRRFEYCADITRTWPVNCRFSEPQRNVYSAVLRVQHGVIEYAKQYGSTDITLQDLDVHSRALMNKELTTLGFEQSEFQRLMPHSVSHSLGMDVHDVTSDPAPIKDGFVFTVEPGLYFPDDDSIPEKYRGINVRIEDDCIATNGDIVCPSQLVPSQIEDIERICGSAVRT